MPEFNGMTFWWLQTSINGEPQGWSSILYHSIVPHYIIQMVILSTLLFSHKCLRYFNGKKLCICCTISHFSQSRFPVSVISGKSAQSLAVNTDIRHLVVLWKSDSFPTRLFELLISCGSTSVAFGSTGNAILTHNCSTFWIDFYFCPWRGRGKQALPSFYKVSLRLCYYLVLAQKKSSVCRQNKQSGCLIMMSLITNVTWQNQRCLRYSGQRLYADLLFGDKLQSQSHNKADNCVVGY